MNQVIAGRADLRLYVLESNPRAVAAYRRCGFDTAPYAIMTRSLE
jgi:ribosomal protein S18 acetylase RimI-like enzyme